MSPQGLNMGLVCSALDKAYRRLPNVMHKWDLGGDLRLFVAQNHGRVTWVEVYREEQQDPAVEGSRSIVTFGRLQDLSLKEFMQWVEQTRILAAL